MTGHIHSIFSGGMVDGPGIRTVVFFAGCNLRCKYCHNPDTWNVSQGEKMTANDIIDEVLKYSSYYKFSGGGITISGGEPLMQPDLLHAVLEGCKKNGMHTAIDTSGCCKPETAKKILPVVDLLMLDIKSFNQEKYLDLTGQELSKTLAFLEEAKLQKTTTWVRYVLVPGFTDDLDEIRQLSGYLRAFDNIQKVEVLPFHKSGEYKWADLNLKYELNDTMPPSPELLKEAKDILEPKAGSCLP